MAILEWDKTGKRYLEYGVKNGVLYVQNTDGTYANGVVWNGLTGVTESPDGAEPNDLYADDMKYASLRSAETFGGTIEAYTYPEEFGECDGTASPVDGLYLGQQKRKPFGFSFVTQVGNDTASDSDTTPVPVHGYKPISTITIDSTKVDSTKLQTLKDLLYGTASAEPTLPDPATVISTLS